MRFRQDSTLKIEEQRAVMWFLTMFFVIYLFYDVFYYFIYKKYILQIDPGLPNVFGYLFYVIFILVVILAYLLKKQGRLYLVKYIFIISYIFFAIINDVLTYDSAIGYTSGNAAEILILLFSPIFVNSVFFWVVSVGIVLKYLLVGFLISSYQVFLAIAVVIILAIIAFILLKRFQAYVKAIKNSFDKQLESIVKGVIATIELKDPYTRGHSERVAFYAHSLAMATGKYSKNDLRFFHYACLLHDIGKVNIPDTILMKPAKLSDDEFEIIKTHPMVGAEAIKKVEGLEESIEIIESHHERWDGRGYPKKLKGNEIPYLARVVAIADAFDAITSSRSYRNALPVEEAFNRIIEGKGTQFDPQLVEIFRELYPKWAKFHNSYQWTEPEVFSK